MNGLKIQKPHHFGLAAHTLPKEGLMSHRFSGISRRVGEKTILVGCCEPTVIEAIRVLLAGRCHVDQRTRMDEFVREASTGAFHSVVLCPNSIAPPLLLDGGLLENAVAAVKAIKGARAVPIVVLSTMSEWRDDLIAAGADVFMAMPLNVTEFTTAVDWTSP